MSVVDRIGVLQYEFKVVLPPIFIGYIHSNVTNRVFDYLNYKVITNRIHTARNRGLTSWVL